MINNKNIIKLDKSIVFVGLMGAGKTSLGKAFAESLGVEFVDSDAVIVEHEGRSIEQIFEEFGEAYFRDLERKVIIELLQDNEPKVIGTGGGAFMNPDTREVIIQKTTSIFLEAALDVLLKRIGSGEGRPLFKDRPPKEVMPELIEARYDTYKKADLSVSTYDEPLQETLNRVQQAVYTHLTTR